jgi:hypothetical protein
MKNGAEEVYIRTARSDGNRVERRLKGTRVTAYSYGTFIQLTSERLS